MHYFHGFLTGQKERQSMVVYINIYFYVKLSPGYIKFLLLFKNKGIQFPSYSRIIVLRGRKICTYGS